MLVGLIAPYGSAEIRGHGFPETIERILAHESLIEPKLTILKPLSAAICIGTGGPFGAEGPIIATGGAFGSLAGQMMKVTSYERKILLAAGSCAGLAAIFGSPVAGILMAIELLLDEYSPRSIIPVSLSCVTAAAMHVILFGKQLMFAMPPIPDPTNLALIIYLVMGFILGISGAYASRSVYAVEDFFASKLKKYIGCGGQPSAQ
ncbi:MAG: chloride channel protein [Chitinophagaceae bacterium]